MIIIASITAVLVLLLLALVTRDRARMAVRLVESGRSVRSILNAAGSHIAILDEAGRIITSNRAWREFGCANGAKEEAGTVANYLSVCDAASGACAGEAAAVAAGIRAVIRGDQAEFALEYPCHSPWEQRWFTVRARRFEGEGPVRVVVSHENISAVKLGEEDRRRLVAAARAQLMDAIESLDAGFVMYDRDERLVVCNAKYRDMYLACVHLMVPGTRYEDIVRTLVASGAIGLGGLSADDFVARRLVAYRNPGEASLIQVAGRWIRLDDHRTSDGGVVSLRTDLTPLVQAREATEAANRAYQEQLAEMEQLYRTAPVGLSLLDTGYRYVRINERLASVSGRPTGEIIGRSVREIIPRLAPSVEAFVARVFATGEPALDLEVHGVAPGDPSRERDWLASYYPVKSADGTPRYVGCVVLDITERKRAEADLRRQQEFLQNVIDHIPAGVFWKDRGGVILGGNHRIASDLGFASRIDMIGKTKFDLPIPRAEAEAATRHDRMVMESDTPVLDVEHVLTRPDGSRIEVSTSKVPLHGPAGEVIGVLAVHVDVTDRRHAERELHEAKEAAESANRAKSEFLANMSHEIRTPMTAMVGFADMMLDPEQSEADRVDGLQTIRRNARHLQDLINEILDLSKIEAGRMTVERVPTDLAPLLSDVMSIMRPRAAEKGVELRLRFEGSVPRRVVTDPMRAKQILVNLVGNAMKFTERGHVEIRVWSDPAEGMLNLDVTDTGIGISPEQLGRLFQPFTQADGSITRRFGGSGLGLTISKRFAQMLGGDISVRSAVGAGSTFTARLAGAGDGSGERCRAEDALAQQPAERAATFERLTGRVLLAEDGRDNQRFISAMLRRTGVEVVLVENGRLAVERAMAEPFDLVLMDMQMPELDGYAATSRLRGLGFTRPIVALTANAMADDRAKCVTAGCTDYLSKPIDRGLLIETVARYVAQSQTAGGAESPRPATAAAAPVGELNGIPTEIVSAFHTDPVMAEVLPEFIANLSAEVAAIGTLLQQRDLEALRESLHQIKGAGGSYGFQVLSDAAAVAERGVKAGAPLDSVTADVDALVALIRRVRGYQPTTEATTEVSHER